MFDNLRDFSDETQNEIPNTPDQNWGAAGAPEQPKPIKRRKKSKKILGMTSQQRFLISVMLFFMVLLLGTFAMFVTGTMSIF